MNRPSDFLPANRKLFDIRFARLGFAGFLRTYGIWEFQRHENAARVVLGRLSLYFWYGD